MSEWRAGTRPGRVSLVRRLVGMLGVLAVLSVLGAAATALAHRPADPPPRQWLRAYGVEVAVPVSRWRLTDRAEAITYGAGATVHAPAVLLCVAFDSIAEGLRNFAGRINAPGAGRSLYPYGFEPGEESGVLGRLRQLVQDA